jgi:hypothetical protein
VQLGDWFVYRMTVTNANPAPASDPNSHPSPPDHGHAFDIVVTDTFPTGVTAFWMEPEDQQEPTGPVDFTPDLEFDANSFVWTILELAP